MNEKEMLLEMYNKYSEQVPALFARRQVENRYFLSISLAILAGLGWMLENCFLTNYPFFMLSACSLGLIICLSWRVTLHHYKIRIRLKCDILRKMEARGLPYPLYEKDRQRFYTKNGKRIDYICCKKCHNFLRHSIPIYSFAFIFLASFIYFLYKGAFSSG